MTEQSAEYGASLAKGNVSLNVQMRTDIETSGVPAKTVEDGRTLDEQAAWVAQSAEYERLPFEFHREHDGSLSLDSAVFQALGAASTCWESLEGTGVFDSTRAKEIGDTLLAFIGAHIDCSGAGQ